MAFTVHELNWRSSKDREGELTPGRGQRMHIICKHNVWHKSTYMSGLPIFCIYVSILPDMYVAIYVCHTYNLHICRYIKLKVKDEHL